MPRIPRLRKGAPEAPQAPEAPTDQPTQVTAGDHLAPADAPAAADGAAAPAGATTSGDPLGAPAPAAGEAPTTAADPLFGSEAPAIDAGEAVAPPPPPDPDPAPVPAVTEPASSTAVVPGETPTVVAPPVAEGVVVTGQDSATVVEEPPADAAPGFRERARIRRRLRYLRRFRELAFRDLGGLTFDLHRFGRDRPDLVAQKLEGLATVDRELRTLETALRERHDLTRLREAGIAACPRCQTLHDTDANFCPGCGTALRGAVVRDAAPVVVAPAAAEQQPGGPAPS